MDALPTLTLTVLAPLCSGTPTSQLLISCLLTYWAPIVAP